MVWDGSAGLIEASGDVTFESESARLGTFEKVMATPDLKQIATPDMFKKP